MEWNWQLKLPQSTASMNIVMVLEMVIGRNIVWCISFVSAVDSSIEPTIVHQKGNRLNGQRALSKPVPFEQSQTQYFLNIPFEDFCVSIFCLSHTQWSGFRAVDHSCYEPFWASLRWIGMLTTHNNTIPMKLTVWMTGDFSLRSN